MACSKSGSVSPWQQIPNNGAWLSSEYALNKALNSKKTFLPIFHRIHWDDTNDKYQTYCNTSHGLITHSIIIIIRSHYSRTHILKEVTRPSPTHHMTNKTTFQRPCQEDAAKPTSRGAVRLTLEYCGANVCTAAL